MAARHCPPLQLPQRPIAANVTQGRQIRTCVAHCPFGLLRPAALPDSQVPGVHCVTYTIRCNAMVGLRWNSHLSLVHGRDSTSQLECLLPSLSIGRRLKDMDTPPDRKRKQVRPLFQVLAGATVLGLLTAGWIAVIGRIQEEDVSFLEYAFYVMPFWYLWALYLLPVIWFAKHRPIESDVWVPRTATHLGVALLLGFTHTSLRFAFEVAAGVHPGNPDQGVSIVDVLALATLEAPVHLFIYGAILGATYLVGYKRRLRQRELATTQLSEQLALAKVQALRMQINPHFLFNAMNSIAMLVRDRKQEEAVKTIAGLSDLLRYVLDDATDQEVPLHRELDFIKRYLAIEQIRFQDRLRVSIDAAESTLDTLVPNLVLQPLVENAIRHGVSRSTAATTITVWARGQDEKLILRVADDGPGFTDEPPHRSSTGLGIANTRKRLAQLYGDSYSLELDNKIPHGAAVNITIPFHTTPVVDGNGEQ